MIPSIGWSEFALKHSQPGTGNSYTTLSPEHVVELVRAYWDCRKPGAGESGLDRKVLVSVAVNLSLPSFQGHPSWIGKQEVFFCPPRVPLQVGMPVSAEVVQRQEGEEPYIQTYVTPEVARQWGFEEIPATHADIVCYSAEALEENGGKRSTDCDWEIVTILCRRESEQEPMHYTAMARNFLEKAGGTKGEYTAREFAEAIWHHSINRGVPVRDKKTPACLQYEVYSSRFDVPEYLYTQFGAATDEEAIVRFREMVARPDNAWDNMRMVAVVAKKETRPVAVTSENTREVKVF